MPDKTAGSMIGKTLGHYKIQEKIGRGGMGEVYLAEDTKLERQVALKILPAEMAADEERRSRFEREAKAIAALSHPNIVTVHSVEEFEGVHFMTMELVRGRTLAELMASGQPLSLDKFFEIAIPLADAVAAAHEQGITHRDLKPANIMVSDDGRVKILDFGLAKLKQELVGGGSDSDLPTEHKTAQGLIIGTVAYMSPEQAEGKSIDHRSDIFSLGIVLYELAAGRRPFSGDSPASTLSSILKDTPPSVTELNTSVPRELGKLIRRSLAKDTERRYQSAKDLRNELEELRREVETGEVLEGAPSRGRGRSRSYMVAIVAGAVVLAVIGTSVVMNLGREGSERSDAPVISGFTQATSDPGFESWPSLAPDGRSLVYSRGGDIYLKRVEGERTFNLTEQSSESDTQPAFSPDGERIAFRSARDGGGLFVMGATGESVRRLTDFGFTPAWSADGTKIYFGTENFLTPYGRASTSARLWSVDVDTGETTELTDEGDAVQPKPSPNGKRIAYWGLEGGQRDIWTIPAEGGSPVPVTQDIAVDGNPAWSPDGSYLYFSSDRGGSLNLWRVPIDESSGEALGEPEPMTTPSRSAMNLTFSGDGLRAAYVSSLVTRNIQKVAFDSETGAVSGTPVPVTQGTNTLSWPHVSPDGEWIAFWSTGSQEDLFVVRTDGTDRRQLTDDLHRDREPIWSHGGERIFFYSDRSGSYQIWSIRPDGSGLEQLTDAPGDNYGYIVMSPDGSRIVFYSFDDGISRIFDPATPWEEQTPEPLVGWEGEGTASPWSWSPDGEKIAGWISGGGVVFYSLADQQYERLTEDGGFPRWLADSRRLVFQANGKLYIVDSETGETSELLASPLGSLAAPVVSTDNRFLFFTLQIGEADIWLVELTK